MAEIVNLRQARKQKARAANATTAAENRIRFGRTRAEREKTEAEARLAAGRIDGHKRDDDKPTS